MIKFNKTITVRLTDEEINFLIELMNKKFNIDNLSDAIRYCIRMEKENEKNNG